MVNVFTVFAQIDDHDHARSHNYDPKGNVNLNATGSVLMMTADTMARPFGDIPIPASTLLTSGFKALTALP